MNKKNIQISIANQMIKCGKNKVVDKQYRDQFIDLNFDVINLAYTLFPSMPSAFQAAIANGLKTNNRDKVIEFCDNFKNNNFKGERDPVYLLWRFMKRASKKPKNIYPSVIFALKSYINNIEIRSIRSDRSKLLQSS